MSTDSLILGRSFAFSSRSLADTLRSVASAVCQRYMEHILAHSLSPTPSLQRIAFDILAIVARSGFGHPLSISPTLVALTSASDPQLAQRAYSMLSLLHQKHASLLATRFVEAVKVCFGYAQATAGEYLLQGEFAAAFSGRLRLILDFRSFARSACLQVWSLVQVSSIIIHVVS